MFEEEDLLIPVEGTEEEQKTQIEDFNPEALLQRIAADYETKKGKNKVVFMSGKSRTYFPADPGSSRFGVAYAMSRADGSVPNPNYLPSDNRMTKPISTKGYGIGGLSGERFVKDFFEGNPAPNAYQQWVAVAVPPRKMSATIKRRSSAESSIADDRKSSLPQESDAQSRITTNAVPLSKEKMRNLCLQSFIGFGSHLSVSRFGKESRFHNVGVGYYDLKRKDAEIRKSCSFGLSTVRLIKPTETRCNYQGYDKCFECDELLKTTDYYRTTKNIKNPFYNNSSTDDRVGALDLDTIILSHTTTASTSLKLKNVFVCLCRRCYCRALRGESRFWNPADVPSLFQKVRHCCYIHEHEGIPLFTHKTDCRFIRKLTRKEILMSKYYKDGCERVLRSSS